MPFPTIFAPLTDATGAQLDACLNFAAAIGVIPSLIGGTNTLTVTPTLNAGPLSAYQDFMVFGGAIANNNSGAVTANAAGLGAVNVFKLSTLGPVPLVGGELKAGNFVLLAYNSALNSSAGGFYVVNSLSTGGGGGAVTSVNGLTGDVVSDVTGFLSQGADVYIEPTGGKSCFINPSAAGQIDRMAIGRTLPFDGTFSGQLQSVSPTASPTGGAVLATFTSLSAQASTLSNTNREFLANLGLTVNTGQGVANGNGAKNALYVGARCIPGTGGHNPGNTRGAQIVVETDSSTGTYTAQGLEIDLINGNPSATVTGIDTTLSVIAGGGIAHWMQLSAVSGSAGCAALGISFAGGATASPITAGGAAILDAGTTGSTVLQMTGFHNNGIYFQSGAYNYGTYYAGGTYAVGINFAGGTYTQGVAFSGGSYTYCLDTMGSSVSAAALRVGNNQAISARNAASSADQLLLQLTPSNQINLGDGAAVNVLCGTVFSGVFGPQIDNNTQCGVAGLAWGSVTSHAYVTVSDPSLKTNIQGLPPATALLKTIDPIAYAMRDDASGARKWGFDARQVHEAFGAAGFEAGHVKQEEGAGGLHAYSNAALLAALWRQNQELLARLEALEAKASGPA